MSLYLIRNDRVILQVVLYFNIIFLNEKSLVTVELLLDTGIHFININVFFIFTLLMNTYYEHSMFTMFTLLIFIINFLTVFDY